MFKKSLVVSIMVHIILLVSIYYFVYNVNTEKKHNQIVFTVNLYKINRKNLNKKSVILKNIIRPKKLNVSKNKTDKKYVEINNKFKIFKLPKKHIKINKTSQIIMHQIYKYSKINKKEVHINLLTSVSPKYPSIIVKFGLDENVQVNVQFVVGINGLIESVKILKSTNKLFNNSVINAIKKWKFDPIIYKGHHIKMMFVKFFIFKKTN